jgi:hydrogenase expression/formation protein HypC
MCLAIPGKVLKVEDGFCHIDFGGETKKAHTDVLVPGEGDWVLVYANQVMEVIPEEKAREILESMKEA